MTSTASHPTLLDLAKQGNAYAIGALLNRQLQLKGITAKANLKDGCLQIMLESAQVPNQQALVEFIRKGITSLGAASIERVMVYGRQAGEEFPAWSQEFELGEQQSPLPSATTTSQSKTIHEIRNKQPNLVPSKTPIKIKSHESSIFNWANLSAKPFIVATSQKFWQLPKLAKFGVVGTILLAISTPVLSSSNQSINLSYSVLNNSRLDEQYKSHLERLIKTQLPDDGNIVSTMNTFQEIGGFNASKERAIKDCKTLSEGTLKEELLHTHDSEALKGLNLYQVEHKLTDEQMKKLLELGKIHMAEVFAAQAIYCPDTRKDFSIKD
jgi:hypothetical protein